MNNPIYNHLVVFSEVLEDDPESTNMHEPVSGKNWRIKTDEFIKLLISETIDEEVHRLKSLNTENSEIDKSYMNLWRARGWLWSISYFLATRNAKFLDIGENANSTRLETLRHYSIEEILPMPKYDVQSLLSIPITTDITEEKITIGKVLRNRHSVSAPTSKGLDSRILFAVLSESLNKVSKTAINLTANGSTNALNSYGSGFDFYLTIYEVENLSPGLYRLNPELMTLDLLKSGNYRHEMSQALIGQQGPKFAACTISIVGDFERYMWRYRHERALSLLWIDAARVMSSIIWSATSRELKMQISPAVIDLIFLEFLNLPQDLSKQCLYSISLA